MAPPGEHEIPSTRVTAKWDLSNSTMGPLQAWRGPLLPPGSTALAELAQSRVQHGQQPTTPTPSQPVCIVHC